jgi:hypothetical protein
MKSVPLAPLLLLACSAGSSSFDEPLQSELSLSVDVSVIGEGPGALVRILLPQQIQVRAGKVVPLFPVVTVAAGLLKSELVVLHNVAGQPDTLVVLARGNVKAGERVSVSYDDFSASAAARATARTTFPVQFLYREPSINPLETRRSFKAAAAGVEQDCGISFDVIDDDVRAAPVNAEKLIRGYVVDDRVPVAVVVPSVFGTVLGETRPDVIRIVTSQSGDSMAGTDYIYELRHAKLNPENAFRFALPLKAYDVQSATPETTYRNQLDRRFNVVIVNARDTKADWPLGRLALHEIGHMLGLNHHDQTEETGDDFGNNWMVQRQNVSKLPQRGTFATPFATATQCAVAGLNLARWAR